MTTPLLSALHAAYLAHLPPADRDALEDVLFLAGLPTVTSVQIQALIGLSDTDLFGDLVRDGATDREVRAAFHTLALDHLERLMAVREAETATTPQPGVLEAIKTLVLDELLADQWDRGLVEDVLEAAGVTNPNEAQVRALIQAADAVLVGKIISWEINDTEVRESLYELAEAHVEPLRGLT